MKGELSFMKKMISIQLDIEIIERLRELANLEGLSVSAYVRRLVLNDLKLKNEEKESMK